MHIVLHTEVGAQCIKLHTQTRLSDVDRCKYCQLSLTNDGPVYHM